MPGKQAFQITGLLFRLLWELTTLLIEIKTTLWIKKINYKRKFKSKIKNLPPCLQDELIKYYEERLDKYSVGLRDILKMMSSGKQRILDEEGLEY